MSVSVMKGGKDGGRTGMGIICRLSVSGIWKLKMLPAGWRQVILKGRVRPGGWRMENA